MAAVKLRDTATKFVRSKSVLTVGFLASFVAMPVYTQTTILQSNVGTGCSSVCINGSCTTTCNGTVTKTSDAMTGNGDIQEKKLDLKDFQSVYTADLDTFVRQGEVWDVKVVADSNLLDKVKVKKDGNQLVARLENGHYNNATISLEITMPDLNRVEQSGSNTMTFSGFDQSALALQIDGAANVTGNNNIVSALDLRVTGSNTVDLRGTELTRADIAVDGASTVTLNFKEATAAGSASISGSINGVAEVAVCGNPENNVEVNGIADFSRIDC